jgi:hypothetical protein
LRLAPVHPRRCPPPITACSAGGSALGVTAFEALVILVLIAKPELEYLSDAKTHLSAEISFLTIRDQIIHHF